VHVVQGRELAQQRKANLGELLESHAGVASSDFGPGVGRPVIRGQAGARVLLLENGLPTMDAATVSSDHAVSLDPAHAEQVEIFKGPATLIYGSAASAGVVNVVDDRLPEKLTPGLSAEAELSYADNASDRSLRAEVGYGSGAYQLHADYANRDAGLLEIPVNAHADGISRGQKRLQNSFVETESAAVSLARIGKDANVSLALSQFETRYGLPQEEEAFIDLEHQRLDLKVQRTTPMAGFSRISLRFAAADYEHTEFEAPGVAGTRFTNDEQQLRVEAEHLPIFDGWRGVIGLQAERRDFAALGEEAFVPPSKSNQLGLFLVEEKTFGALQLEGGLRLERSSKRPDADTELARRSHTPVSLSLGALWTLTPAHHLRVTASRNQRAPTAEELYAFGPHLATATFERGDEGFGNETVSNLEFNLDKHLGRFRWSLTGYLQDSKNYLYTENVDCNRDADDQGPCNPDGKADWVDEAGAFLAAGSDEGLQLVDYRRADARFYGYEVEASYQLLTGAPKLKLTGFADQVWAERDDGSNLPRISPARIGLGINGNLGAFTSHVQFIRVQKQEKTAALETATPGYNLLAAGVNYRHRIGATVADIYLQGRNLLDEEARRHTSFLKDVAPLGGRSVILGARLGFGG
jgi:iron complex outermembrane receptor protein